MKYPKPALALVILALLAGCSATTPTQGPPGWGYQPGQTAPTRISEAEAETLTTQYLDMKNQRTTMENALRTTTDPAARSRFAQSITTLNQQMAPLEYRLRSAGRPIP